MNPFGDGSDGPLNVASGTARIALNKKHQFTTVNIASGAVLSTSSTTGAVMYISATESVKIDGKVNLKGIVAAGDNEWAVTIDGTEYKSAGVADGADSKRYVGSSVGSGKQYKGFGGGGGGSGIDLGKGGDGGNGGTPAGVGSPSVSIRANTNQTLYKGGNNGQNSAGGSGAAHALWQRTSGNITGYTNSGNSGGGGSAYGANGGDGGAGNHTFTGGNGTYEYNYFTTGGGGAGGIAGSAGVTLVLNAPSIEINGEIITAGTNGGNAGNGGRNRSYSGFTNYWGQGGGGGGGGNAGSIKLNYATTLTDNGTYTVDAGLGGTSGVGGFNNADQSSDASDGTTGAKDITQLKPIPDFTASPTSGGRPLAVTFTNKTLGGATYLWTFGDGSTSTANNPTKTYATVGTFSVTLKATNGAGNNSVTKTSYITTTLKTFTPTISGTFKMGGGAARKLKTSRSISGGFVMGGNVFMVRKGDTANIQKKTFLFKVYDEVGNFKGILDDVVEDGLNYTKEINTPGSSVDLELARNSDSRDTVREQRTTTTGAPRTTTDGFTRTVTTASKPKVGPGSDLNYNNRVDVWIYYGSETPRTVTDGRERTTTEGDTRTVVQGAPNGRIKYSGFISQINTKYGSTETTNITLMSYGYDLDQYVYTDGSSTKVIKNTQPASQIVEDALDRFATVSSSEGTYTTYSDTSIDNSSTAVSYTYRVNTYLEVIQKAIELAPPDWYWHVDLGLNNVHFHERSATPRHTFFLGKHIKDLNLRSSIEDAVNDVIYTGGETIEGDPNSVLFRRYTRTPAQYTRRGLDRMSDGRVTLPTSADILATGRLAEANLISYKTSITILDKAYDIEDIEVGDTVGFRNFGNHVDSLVLQIVGLTYSTDEVNLQLDSLSPAVPKRLIDLRRAMTQTETQVTPNTPTNA